MYKKQVFILILILLFSFSCKKKDKDNTKKNLDKVFLKGEVKFKNGSIYKSLLKEKSKLISSFNPAYKMYLKNSGQKGSLSRDINLLSKKVKNFNNIKFWLRKDHTFKIELTGINVIDILETFYSPIGQKVESYKDTEFIWIEKDKKLILASKKNTTVITMKIDIDEVFSYEEPENLETLKTIIEDKNKDDFDFYFAFSYKNILDKPDLPYFFKSFESGLFRVFYDKAKKENSFSLVANLGKEESVDAKIYLNSLYKEFLPTALKEVKNFRKELKSNKEFNANISKKNQRMIFKAINFSLKNVKISYDNNYLSISSALKGLDEEASRLSNLAIIGILGAIAVPFYQQQAVKF